MAPRKTSPAAAAPTPTPDASSDPFVKFLLALKNATDDALKDVLTDSAPAGKTRRSRTAPATVPGDTLADEQDADEDEDTDPMAARKAELESKTLKQLQKIATDAGFDKADVKEATAETLVESILADEKENAGDDAEDEDADEPDEDEAEEDADEDEDDEEEESEGYTREELLALSLTALKRLAKDEFEMTVADLKGKDKDEIVDLILSDDDEEDEEEDDEDEDETDEDAEDDDEEGYTEDELNDLSLTELKDIAREWEIKVRPGTKQAGYVKAILAAQEDPDA